MVQTLRTLALALWFLLAVLLVMKGDANAVSTDVVTLNVKGAVSPVMASYIDRGISSAENRGAAAVVIQLDTPGGLDSSMRDIVQRINRSQVPVVVYVSPSGARAASAGAFITMAAHVAAMAPNTAIGAAHPVAGGGEQLTETQASKATNDAAAFIKSIADLRGRNAVWAEKAVRDSISATVTEAVQDRVVDMEAVDLQALLLQIDGREVALISGKVTIETKGRQVLGLDMNVVEKFLFAISDPNIAFLLMSIAMMAIFLELSNPGAILPGIVGGIFLLLALFGLGMLPVNIAGVLLIALGFLLFLTEVWVTAYGMLTIGGVLALTVGAMILFSGSNTGLRVDPKLIFTVAALVTAFVVLVVGSVMRSRRQPSISGKGGLIGAVGFATTDLDPYGLVIVHGERWKARTEGERIGAGQRVVVTEIEGLELTVESYGAEILPLPKEGPLLDEGEGTETPVALPPGREQQSDTAS